MLKSLRYIKQISQAPTACPALDYTPPPRQHEGPLPPLYFFRHTRGTVETAEPHFLRCRVSLSVRNPNMLGGL
ncbi:hypothetical protein NH8B_0101 [Pseudogulbenkiania sp. NH8B]|uniref:hypothetical protein n=1 Tax=Pseudogulbenkiania sp. (strain NH8B) TaxID=748280 RepID=UPI00022797F6|nr:hypothetical protein [Pseudogulbenkiania sp. NH8B]BAK74950.1 hypothetical protein NH8B_0101 [Pseudogulbenkiania sp. NH8B]